MKVKELIYHLSRFDPEAQVLIGSDEELNTLYEGFEVSPLEGTVGEVVIYGLTGEERYQEGVYTE